MSTVVNKSPRKGFTAIDNNAVRDNRLRLKTRGLLAYIMSLPPGWVLSMQWLQNQTGEGRDSIQGCFKELSTYGYAKMLKFQNESGQFNGSRWTVTDIPNNFGEGQDAAESAVFEQNNDTGELKIRQQENPVAGKSGGVINNKEYNKKEYKKEREREALPEKPKSNFSNQPENDTVNPMLSRPTFDQVIFAGAKLMPVEPLPSENPFNERERAATYYENSQYVIQQGEKYTTDSDLVAVMANYYRNNPQEYKIGILQDAKGARFTPEQIKDFTVMWASHAIANNKYNRTAHQLHMDLKRWILRESQYNAKSMKQAGSAAAPVIKKKTVDFI
jgi:hypothetical protein